jgi:uncharacterized protein (DUF2267 family)
MDYESFIAVIRDALGGDREAADWASRSVLSVLGERLGADEGLEFVPFLPTELAAWLHSPGGARPFDAEEFVGRVAEREKTDLDTAERHTVFVLAALARTLPDREWDHLVAHLSKDHAPLLPTSPTSMPVSAGKFLDRVAQRAGITADEASRLVDTVLETLAERITTGEALDLTTRLPVRFHAALKQGAAHANAATRRMSPDDFIRRVARRTGVRQERARDYARAVLSTVREAVGEEFLDVTAQLPQGYGYLVGGGRSR